MAEFQYVRFQSKHDTLPVPAREEWETFCSVFHDPRAQKDGPLFSPAVYVPGATRHNDNVEYLTAFVADIDDGTAVEQIHGRFAGYACLTYSTHSSTAEHPKWRAVFPLAKPVAAADWPRVWRRLNYHLTGGICDPSSKDPSRMYYLPACPKERMGAAFLQARDGALDDAYPLRDGALDDAYPLRDGAFLDADAFSDPPEDDESDRLIAAYETRAAKTREGGVGGHSGANSGGLKPGEDYSERVTADEIAALLEGDGWHIHRRRGMSIQLTRPGKNDGISGVVGFPDNPAGVFHCFTSSSCFEAKSHSPFGVYGQIVHAGDFAAAAKALGALGYGEKSVRVGFTPKDEDAPPLSGYASSNAPPARGEPFTPDAAWNELIERLKESASDKGPSDLAAAQEWAKMAEGRWLYVEGDQWYAYSSGVWRYNNLESVQADIQAFLTRVRAQMPSMAVTRARILNVLFLGKSLLGPVPLSGFDARPDWIPVQNGVYDTQTGELRPHAPEHRLTRLSPLDYDPQAHCPRWDAFLAEVMLTEDGKTNWEWISFLQEWYGYCLLSDASAQASMMWIGEGQNGKGTATRVLEKLVGKAHTTAIPIEQLHDPYHRAELHGKLVGFVNEPDPKSMLKNGSHFKALVGGDSMSARRPTEKVFTFTPYCHVVISCNSLPSTRDLSHGYFRRILLVEWRYKVPDDKRDGDLDDVLAAEISGIFNWALEGLNTFRARKKRFAVPQASVNLLKAYREGEDTLHRFLEECTAPDATGFVGTRLLYSAYRKWCSDTGETHRSADMIAKQMKKKGWHDERKRVSGEQMRGWVGLILSDDEEE